MADELDPITQVFDADMAPYIEEMKRAEDEARKFAADNSLADDALRGLANAVKENTAMLDVLAAEMRKASDEANKLRDDSFLAGEGLGHLRDESLEAAAAEKELGNQARDTAAKLDLMGLSGASTFSSIFGLVGVIGALVVAVAGVAPAVLAMGMGLGAFGLFAAPAIAGISSGLKTITADQKAVDNATTALAKNKALAKLQHDWAAIPAPIAAVIKQIQALKSEFSALSQSSGIQAAFLKDVTLILQTLRTVLPELIPLAKAGAQAFGLLISSLSKSLTSKGFTDFLQLMTSLVVPATKAIIGLAGALTGVLGGAISDLSAYSVPFIGMLTGLVNVLGPPLTAALRVGVQLFLGLYQVLQPLLPGLSEFATELINGIGNGFQAVFPILHQVTSMLAGPFMQILHDLLPILENTFTPNSPFVMALRLLPTLLQAAMPLLNGIAKALGDPMIAQAVVWFLSLYMAFKQLMMVVAIFKGVFLGLTAIMEVNPIILIATAIALLVLGFIELWNHCAAFRNFWIGLWADIKSIMAPVVSWIQNVIADMSRWWSDHGKTVIAILKAAWAIIESTFKVEFGLVTGIVKTYLAVMEGVFKAVWNTISIATKTAWDVIYQIVNAVIKTIQQTIDLVLNVIHGNWGAAWKNLQTIASVQLSAIENIIKSVASGFINILYTAGRDLIQGFINGIKAMWGTVTGLISNLGSSVSSIFSSVLHILSPSRVFYQHGLNTMMGLVHGLLAGAATVHSTMTGIAKSVASTTVPTPAGVYGAMAASAVTPSAGATGGGNGQIVVNVDGQKLFTVMQSQIYRYNVRNSGTVTGVVVPGSGLAA